MRPIALATCAALPAEADESALEAALDAAGVAYEWAVWNDPAVDWARYATVLIRTTWDYHDHVDEFLAWADRVGAETLLWNPPAVVRWNSHKGYLRDLDAAGVPIVPTAVVEVGTKVDLAGLTREQNWTEIVVKPATSAGALGAARFATTDDSAQAHLDALVAADHDVGRDAIVQPFLPDVVDAGELSVIVVDGTITHAVRKVPAPGDYRSQPEWGGRLRAEAPDDTARAVARQAWHAAHDLTASALLYARVDLIETDAGPRLIELEAIEPDLFLGFDVAAARALVTAVQHRVGAEGDW